VVILIFNQEQLGNAQENKDILNLSILQGKEKIFHFYSSSFDCQFHWNKSMGLLSVAVKVDVNRLVVVYFINVMYNIIQK